MKNIFLDGAVAGTAESRGRDDILANHVGYAVTYMGVAIEAVAWRYINQLFVMATLEMRFESAATHFELGYWVVDLEVCLRMGLFGVFKAKLRGYIEAGETVSEVLSITYSCRSVRRQGQLQACSC